MSEKIVIALIGVVAFIVAQVALFIFTQLRDSRLRKVDRVDIARLADAELTNIVRHMEANIVNLDNLLEGGSEARAVDFEKLKLSEMGLLALDVSKIYLLEEGLMQDLLRLSLFCRNNDLEVDYYIQELTSDEGTSSDLGMFQLKFRFEATRSQTVELQSNLRRFILSPQRYTNSPVTWKNELFKSNAAVSAAINKTSQKCDSESGSLV